MKFDFNNTTITSSQIGDGNIMINTVNDEEKLLEALKQSICQLDKESDEYKLAEQAAQYVESDDKKSLGALLKNNLAVFTQTILSGMAYDFIKKFIP